MEKYNISPSHIKFDIETTGVDGIQRGKSMVEKTPYDTRVSHERIFLNNPLSNVGYDLNNLSLGDYKNSFSGNEKTLHFLKAGKPQKWGAMV